MSARDVQWRKSAELRRILIPFLAVFSLSLGPYVKAAQSQQVIAQIDLQGLEPITIEVSPLTNQSYVPGQSFVDGNQGLAVVNNKSGEVSFLPLEGWRLAGGIGVDQRTGRTYVTLDGGASPDEAVGFIDASGTELLAFQLFNFQPEDSPFPPGKPLIATNEATGQVFLLGSDGSNTAIGVFEHSRQEPSIPVIQDLAIIPLPDLFFPAGVAVNSQTNRAYVPAQNFQGQNILVVIDGKMLSVIDTVVFGDDFFFPLSLAVNETTNRIYVTGNGLTTIWALAEVNGTDHSVDVIPLTLQPYDIGISEASNEVVVVGLDDANEGEAFFFDALSRTLRTIPLGTFSPHGVSVNETTGIIYIGGLDFSPDFAPVILAIGQPVCDAEPTTIEAIRAEVLTLPTSQVTIDDLVGPLDAATRSLNRADNESARLAMTRFIRRLVQASNLVSTNPDGLALAVANGLICSASNVLVGVPLP